jgi:two-component system chemotaxis response regulator CheY
MAERRALVVDDSLTTRSMVSVAFKRMGWFAEVAKGADEALAFVDRGDHFDVIITDINMPGMNGIELIGELRKRASCKTVPILALTTEGGDNMKKQGKAQGANGWITKPFRPEVLEAAVGKLCG